MRRQDFGELTAFMAVAEERSFTRAAAKLGTSQSTLSQTIRRLEMRLDLRLLTRTTRSVAPTEAGERLLETLKPAFEDIDSKLAALTKLREKPAGAVRINATEHVAQTVLWPAIRRLLPDYPDIQVELTGKSALTDIVVGRYDAGVRLGELVDKDMIAVRIGPQLRMAAVASPAYFARKPPPRTPHDLAPTRLHQPAPSDPRRALCLGVREGRSRTEGEGRWSTRVQQRRADRRRCSRWLRHWLRDERLRRTGHRGCSARERVGGLVAPVCRLSPLLPSRRQLSPAFALVVEALRYRD